MTFVHFPKKRPEFPSDFATLTKHRCSFGSSGRCPCGLHREPERATYILPESTDLERLSVEL